MERFTGVLGIAAILIACWFFSTDRKAVKWKIMVYGIGLQFMFAFLVLKFETGQKIMAGAGVLIQMNGYFPGRSRGEHLLNIGAAIGVQF